jgi:acyl-CoA synthetase (AMP-forming)/AMP-acid ligase II
VSKFTGGTSGEPKGVIQTHGNMLAVIENLQAFFRFERSDCNLAVAPLTHGSSHYVFPVLGAGGRHRFLHEHSAAAILAAMRDNTTVTFMPPTLIYKLLETPGLSPGQFPRLRHLTYSAAPMPSDRIIEAQQAFGPCISSLYGQTEAPLTICAVGADEMQCRTRHREARRASPAKPAKFVSSMKWARRRLPVQSVISKSRGRS